jgi:hypothetical protein
MAQKKFIIDAGFKANGDSIVEGNLNVNSTPTEGTHAVTKAYVDDAVANGAPNWSTVTTNTTLSANTKYVIDTTSSAITVTLPSSPSFGDEVRIIDGDGNASTNNITLTSSDNIQGAAGNILISADRAAFAIVYYNQANGWLLTEI